VVTPVNPIYTEHELAKQLKASGATFVISAADSFEITTKAAKQADCEVKHIVLGDTSPVGAVSFDSLRRSGGSVEQVDLDTTPGGDLILLPYSSGTTGLPKGVMLTHNNMISNLYQSNYGEGRFYSNDVILSPLPMFHIYGLLFSLLLSCSKGQTLVTMPRFDLDKFCSIVETYKCTRAHLVPPIVLQLAKDPLIDEYDLSSLEMIVCAAAPLQADLERAAGERLNLSIKQAWGMSELSPIGTCVADDEMKPFSGTVGPPAAGTSMKIISLGDEDAEEDCGTVDPSVRLEGVGLAPGEVGELCVKGPQVMKGYVRAPEKTQECLTDDGWLLTGDVAYMDEDGFVFITDRIKELIKYKGYQVPPAELEDVVMTHPEVQDCTIIPVEDDEAGELPRAYVVPKEGVALEGLAQSVMDFVAERVAPYKKLRGGVVFTDSIPKTASGKILRRLVIDQDRAPKSNE
jgi:acyl-CoA synthetase (AMP-forming)/AMP-acid ligase II